MFMSKGRSNSSLSSFQNQQTEEDNLPTFHPRHREEDNNHNINSLRMQINKNRYSGEELSEFEDEYEDRRYKDSLRRIEESTIQIITKLKQEIAILKSDNKSLNLKNSALMQQLERTKHQKIRLQQKKQQQQNEQIRQNKKQKIQTLIQQISRIKQNTNKLRIQSDKDTTEILTLRDKIQQYERKEMDWSWKNKFIDLFIDMLRKISEGIQEDWSDKKKIQIGWKIVKNMVDKAINAGIKVPKIQRNRL